MNQYDHLISQRQIAEQFGVSKSTACRMMTKLEALGHKVTRLGRTVRMKRKAVYEAADKGLFRRLPQQKPATETRGVA